MSTPIYAGYEAKAYYVEETTYGETPSGAGEPAMQGIGVVQNVEPAVTPNLVKIRGIGSRDLAYIKKGLRAVDLKIVYVPQDITFLNYVISLKSMSVEVFYDKTEGVVSLNHKGCRINRLTVKAALEEKMEVTAELYGQNLVVGTAKIGASYTDPTGSPKLWYDSYVKKGGSTLENVSDFSFTVNNNLRRVPVIRSTSGDMLKYLTERQRDLSGEIVCDFVSKDELDDIVNDSEFTLEFGLGGSNKAVFSNCKWDSSVLSTRIEELVAQKLPFTAKTVTIS